MSEELLADFDSFTAPSEVVVEPTTINNVDPLVSDFDTFTQEETPQIEEDITEVKWKSPGQVKRIIPNTYKSLTDILMQVKY